MGLNETTVATDEENGSKCNLNQRLVKAKQASETRTIGRKVDPCVRRGKMENSVVTLKSTAMKRSPPDRDSFLEVKKVRLSGVGIGDSSRTAHFSALDESDNSKSLNDYSSKSEILLVDMNDGNNLKDLHNYLSSAEEENGLGRETDTKKKLDKVKEEHPTLKHNSIEYPSIKVVKRLTREELERIVLDQICLAIRERGITGILERQLEVTEEQLDRYRRKTETLTKQINDLTAVVKRFVGQAKSRKDALLPPPKITREVGLQINMQAVIQQGKNDSVKRAVTTIATSSNPITTPVKAKSSQLITSTSNSGSNTQGGSSIPRVPLPPSFTMQSSDIAPYVPQQAIPRYRTSVKKSNDSSVSSLTSSPGSVNSSPTKGKQKSNTIRVESKSTTPTAPILRRIAPLPIGAQNSVLGNVNSSDSTVSPLVKSTDQNTVALATVRSRIMNGVLSNASASSPVTNIRTTPPTTSAQPRSTGPTVTTVNKVTLPGSSSKTVIDLTGDEQEKSVMKAAARSVVVKKTTVATTIAVATPSSKVVGKPVFTLATTSTSASVSNSRLVAVKSTTLNGPLRNGSGLVTLPNAIRLASPTASKVATHPAPLPPSTVGPVNPSWKLLPPKPTLKISRIDHGIVLSWTMQITENHAVISSYQLFAYQEGSNAPSSTLWKKVGDVKALPLPMACTLTQFLEGHRYHFAVRAMDAHSRVGPYSDPSSILLS